MVPFHPTSKQAASLRLLSRSEARAWRQPRAGRRRDRGLPAATRALARGQHGPDNHSAEGFLNCPEIVPIFEEMGCKGMTEGVAGGGFRDGSLTDGTQEPRPREPHGWIPSRGGYLSVHGDILSVRRRPTRCLTGPLPRRTHAEVTHLQIPFLRGIPSPYLDFNPTPPPPARSRQAFLSE